MTKYKKIFDKTETKLVLFLFYVISLVCIWMLGRHWWDVVFVHLFFVLIFSIFYFGGQFLWFFFAPLIAIFLPVQTYFINRYLRNYNQNIPAEAVVVLGRYNWFKMEAWVKPNFFKDEIALLVKLLESKRQNFSFYPDANFEDVEKIMSNRNIKEVYFFGHGDSHTFQLNNDYILYYCDFNDFKYGKEFVHQVHCGDPYGKSLIDYIVPKENRAKCFLFRKSISLNDIKKELRHRIRSQSQNIRSEAVSS
jgi:energy-coupling factor transporter transmembrane protein EcfT